MARIGVEGALTDVKEALMEMGHEVVELRSPEDAAYCDCCIITGQDKDMTGIATTSIAGPVINATGQNADDICQMVNEKLS
ncbi:YkuS family protein [Virgibacillus sp. NKC19-16]|uniref:YkuS family protein n=1 Tax=Virgibacillus salidurans TaxID=2831673 RepID=UPI001F1FA410|nr:YkuS family protein [Virgibacillus sp. NKC19-16]UJL47791.1 YkuS family protein [Virgibacillus sp. NKC19-16]